MTKLKWNIYIYIDLYIQYIYIYIYMYSIYIYIYIHKYIVRSTTLIAKIAMDLVQSNNEAAGRSTAAPPSETPGGSTLPLMTNRKIAKCIAYCLFCLQFYLSTVS